MSAEWELVVGLEVHAHLKTRTKMFCRCELEYGAAENTHTCPVCLAHPGALPVPNARAIELTVLLGLALDCEIAERAVFASKNYFYPDLPKGYQISQYDEPFSARGYLDIEVGGAGEADAKTTKRIGITRVHMEEDAGKSLHAAGHGDDSIVDLNRSGVPLVEIVGEPDLRSAADAAEYLRTLRDVLLFLGVNDGNLEEGSFRCDANVSIRKKGETKLGTRAELKNINSFRFVQKAIEHEIERQEQVLESGGRIVQETRGWDEKHGKTFSMRSKEAAQDYRYFPEPDLAPLVLTEVFVEQVRREMPELPREKRARFVREMQLTPYAAGVLTAHPRVAAFFEEAATLHGDPVKVANFVQSEILRDVTTHGLLAKIPVEARQLAELLKLVDKGRISGKQAKEVYAKVANTERRPADVVAELGIEQVTDAGAIEEVVRLVVEKNPKQAEQLRSGKVGLTGFFVGQVMKETKGSANPQLVNDALKKVLGLP